MGAWIEISRGAAICRPSVVAPHVGAWIEIPTYQIRAIEHCNVAPHVGAWIEMPVTIGVIILPPVAPHVGAWIEIKYIILNSYLRKQSHPMWVRGLKLKPLPLLYLSP